MSKHVPRIYIANLDPSIKNEIPMFHVKHLLIVLRMKHRDTLFIFSEDEGEWVAELHVDGKDKRLYAQCVSQIKEPAVGDKICLAFGIIKHDNLMYMIEKAVELGVTDLYPIITEYTNVNSIKLHKISKSIIFATEQSGRISLPRIHNILKFNEFMKDIKGEDGWYSAIERIDSKNVGLSLEKNIGFIVGPEGGFSDSEQLLLRQKTKVISLSNNILRSETAAISCLSIASFLKVSE